MLLKVNATKNGGHSNANELATMTVLTARPCVQRFDFVNQVWLQLTLTRAAFGTPSCFRPDFISD
jgi:hypothetical protein